MAWSEERHGRKLPQDHEHAEDSPIYKAGQEIEVSETTARHFVNKGVAEEVAKRQRETPKTLDEPKPAVK